MALRQAERELTAVLTVPKRGPLIKHLEQEEDEWCWVACQLMVLAAKGDYLREQCELAKPALGLECCDEDVRPQCCQRIVWSRVKELWHDRLWEVKIRTEVEPILYRKLQLREIQDEINGGRPVQIWLGSFPDGKPDEGIGHLVMVAGYYIPTKRARETALLIQDPAKGFGPCSINFRELLGDNSWVGSWIYIG